nr:MAG TPA: hypothetical protein [Caudoviricetes sp.]
MVIFRSCPAPFLRAALPAASFCYPEPDFSVHLIFII